jgi:hypothetical protein
MTKLEFFRDSAIVMSKVFADYLYECGAQLTSDGRAAALDAYAKTQEAAFALIRLTDELDGVERLEWTPEGVSYSSSNREETKDGSRLIER